MQRHRIANIILTNWWVRHTLFWICFLIYWTILLHPPKGDPRPFYINTLKYIPGWMMVVYSLLNYFIPKFLMKKKFIRFILGYGGVIAVATVYTELFKLNFTPLSTPGSGLLTGRNVLPFIHVSALAASAKFIRHALLQEIRATQAKKQKTIAELELLKAQIHPHFLFNTLNNLFAHTMRGSSQSSQIVIKLSELLRFMIYESKTEHIELEKEIDLLNNYIDLEKLRYGSDLEVSTTYSGDLENKLISPLLLLPLVENSFKHGTSQQLDRKWIKLDLHVEGNKMFFKLANSRDEDMIKPAVKGKRKGIGLDNVRKRLEILYPYKHEFKILEDKHSFLVSISLELDDAGVHSIKDNPHLGRKKLAS
jgi:sensor histidine kinase YesM